MVDALSPAVDAIKACDSTDLGDVFEAAAAGATTVAGFLTILFAVVLSGICIFFLDKKWAFGKTDMTEAEIKKISLVMAIATAPYTFFIPLY